MLLPTRNQRSTSIRTELQKLGVTKVDLAYKAVQDAIVHAEDGRLVAHGYNGEQPVAEFLATFVHDSIPSSCRPGLRGYGNDGNTKGDAPRHGRVDLDKISPSMSKEELDRTRQEILRVITTQT